MANEKQRTVEELMRNTEKLTERTPSCVLEGKARMRGPGVNDEEPSDDAASREVFCDICGSKDQETDIKVCSTCWRRFHTSCLGLPINNFVGVDWLCSKCQATNSGPRQASELYVDYFCDIQGEEAMTCSMDSKGERQDELLKVEVLSGSQQTSCLESKSGGKLEDDVVRTLETASCSEVEDDRKSAVGNGEGEQSLTPENVRRSKRGRPYKPVGGLHPNKRRIVDGNSRQTDKAQQGKPRVVVDEEDELGAKIEKFRVISSIDEQSANKVPPDLEDIKKTDSLRWDEEDGNSRTVSTIAVQREQTSQFRNNAEVNLGLESPPFATKGRTSEEDHKFREISPRGTIDSKAAGGSGHDMVQGKISVEEAFLKAEYDAPEGLLGGSLAPSFTPSLTPNSLVDDQGCEGGHPAQVECQHTFLKENLGIELDEKPRQGQKAECFDATQIPTLHEVINDKDGSKLASGSSTTNFESKTRDTVHSALPRLETPGRFSTLLDTSNDMHVLNDGGFSVRMNVETTKFSNKISVDGLKTLKSSTSDESGKEVGNLVAYVKGDGTEQDFEHSDKGIPRVQDADRARHLEGAECNPPGQREPKIAISSPLEDQGNSETKGKGETGDVTSAAVTARASPGGNPVDSTGSMSKRDFPSATSSGPEVAGKGARASQTASLEEEDDVKVCDICGDAGYEECLSICSMCNDGAEHIYCMQVLLHAVPEDWLCETCKFREKNGNLKKVEDLPLNKVPSKSAYMSPKKGQFSKGNTRSRLSAVLDKGKGSSLQKVVTKGPSTNHLPDKRPADDAQTAPSMKKQMRENIGTPATVTNACAPRGLTRENSVKAPDSGKVKFLSPNALATSAATGGSRSFSKSSSFSGLPSQSLRPGPNQLSHITSKNKSVSNSYAAGDSVICGASPPTKQSPTAPKAPSFNAKASTLPTGRGPSLKSNEPIPSFLLPSRPGASVIAKGSKEGNFEGNGLHNVGRDANAMSAGGGVAKGWGISSSGKHTTKWIDTPRPSTQSTTFGRQLSGKGDPAISLQSADNNVIPGRPLVQKVSPTLDVTKGSNNMARLPSLGRPSNQQASRDDAQRNLEVQPMKGSRQPPTPKVDCFDPGASRVATLLDLPTSCNNLSSGATSELAPGRKGDQQAKDVLRTHSLSSSDTVVNGQKSTSDFPHRGELRNDANGKWPSKSCRGDSTTKQLVVDATHVDLLVAGKDKKSRDNSEMGSSCSALVAPPMNRRFYTCKEIGGLAQDGDARITGTVSLPDICAESMDSIGAISSPKEALGSLSSGLLGQRPCDTTPVGVLQSGCLSSADRDAVSQVLDPDCTRSVPFSGKSTGVQQGQGKEAGTGISEKVSKYSTEDKRKHIPAPLILNQGKAVLRLGNQVGPLAAIRKSTEPFDLESFACTDGLPAAPNSINHVSLSKDFSSRNSVAPGKLTKTQSLLTVSRRVQEDVPKISHEGEQVSVGQTNFLGDSVTRVLQPPPPPPPPLVLPLPLPPPLPRGWGESRPLEPQIATQLTRQTKAPVPWAQLASPKLFLGVDRALNQDNLGKRLFVVGPGVGAPGHWNPCAKAVPESQCLWRGGFEVMSAAVPAFYDGIIAYSSSFAAPQVRAVTKKLPHRLQLGEVRRMFSADAWPKQFQQRPPTATEIALYFFPLSDSCDGGYMILLDHMKTHDLVLIGQVEGAELLIFPSQLLPLESRHWKSKMFLWGVYRAKPSNPVFKPRLPSLQTPVEVPIDFAMKGLASSELEKVALPETPIISSTSGRGEVDMEIDMVGHKDFSILPCNSSQIAACDQLPSDKLPPPPPVTIPPLPHEPPPVQPPPPDLIAACVQEVGAAEAVSGITVTSVECCSGDLDLPPGFGPGPQKRVPRLIQPPDISISPSGIPELKADSDVPPGFEKVREGVLTIQTQVHAEDTTGSTTDVDTRDLTSDQLPLIMGNNAPERSWTSLSSRRTSPFPHLSPSPRDLRDDSAGTFWLSTPRHSHSRSKSPKRHRDRLKDHGGGKSAFDGRESARSRDSRRESGREIAPGRESGRDRGREKEKGGQRERVRDREKARSKESGKGHEKGRDRERERDTERDRQTEREKEKERRRDRWHHRKREMDMKQDDRCLDRDHGIQRDYRESRGRGRERKLHGRTRSPSRSQSRSYSNSRAGLESLSVSPKKRSSGKSHSLHRSRSYSDSPESIHGNVWRKPPSSDGPTASMEHSQDGSSSGRKVTSRPDDIDRDGKHTPRDLPEGEASYKARLSIFSREGSIRTRDLTLKEDVSAANETFRTEPSIPFYDIQKDDADTGTMDRGIEKTMVESAPFYHVFLPGESDDTQMFETSAGDHADKYPLRPNMQPSVGVLKHPQLGTTQTSAQLESDKATERSGYDFFPLKGGNVGDLRNSTSDLELGETDGMIVPEPVALPFFVPLVDTTRSPEPGHRFTDLFRPADKTVEFPSVTGKKDEPVKAELGSLNLSLAVNQYKRDGNAWPMLGGEDVNFALTL